MKETPPLQPEIVDEEAENRPEDQEYGFVISLPEAYIYMGSELDTTELTTLCNEIMDKVELLDSVNFNEHGELRVLTKFGEPDFWKDKIPEIKKVIKDFLQTKRFVDNDKSK